MPGQTRSGACARMFLQDLPARWRLDLDAATRGRLSVNATALGAIASEVMWDAVLEAGK